VGVSSTPGFTTSMQEVVLDKNIRLIDSPGVVFCDDDGTTTDVSLKNCVDPSNIPDPVAAIKALLARCSQRSLMMAYEIPAFPSNDESIFLGMIAKKYGKLLKGGVPDKVAAARCILYDWNSGKVPFYTSPPLATEDTSQGMDSKIMTTLGKEFDVSQMMTKYDTALLDAMDDNDPMDFVEIKSSTKEVRSKKAHTGLEEMEEEEEEENGSEDDMNDEEDDSIDSKRATPITMLNNSSLAEADDYDFM
jgi:nuclear GTP-binding protein